MLLALRSSCRLSDASPRSPLARRRRRDGSRSRTRAGVARYNRTRPRGGAEAARNPETGIVPLIAYLGDRLEGGARCLQLEPEHLHRRRVAEVEVTRIAVIRGLGKTIALRGALDIILQQIDVTERGSVIALSLLSFHRQTLCSEAGAQPLTGQASRWQRWLFSSPPRSRGSACSSAASAPMPEGPPNSGAPMGDGGTLLWSSLVTSAWTLLAVLVVTAIVIPYRFTSRRYRQLVSRIPGPPAVPIVGNGLLIVVATRRGVIPLLKKLREQYGSFFKLQILGLTHIMISDVDMIEKLLGSVSFITKSFDYHLLKPWLGDGLLLSTGGKWHSRRKLLTPAFHFRILEDYLPVFTRCSRVLVEKLRERTGDPYVPVNDLITLCTLDVICETAMGTRIDAQEGKGVEYVSAVLRMSELFQKRQLTPWLWRPWLFALSPTGFEQRRVLRQLHGFTTRVIVERQAERRAARRAARADSSPEPPKKKRRLLALLDLLLEVAESEPGALSLDDIREEVDTFMFEGHDTTSAALSWVIFLLSLNPKEQEKAWQEQAAIFGDSAREPTMEDLGRMRYLEQVVKEALRLYPSVPAFSRVLERETVIGEYTVPAGAFLTFSPLLLHRDERLWPQPARFRPERFGPEEAQRRHPFAYIPFSAGPRGCIGQRFALLEEKAVLSAVLRHFRLEAVHREEDVRPLMELILRPERSVRVRFVERAPAHLYTRN